jgi:glycerol-3-phosphate acyltransferase PlsY
VAVASVGSAVINTIYIYFALDSFEMFAASFVFAIFMAIRHRKNFERIIKGEENKISWM